MSMIFQLSIPPKNQPPSLTHSNFEFDITKLLEFIYGQIFWQFFPLNGLFTSPLLKSIAT